MKLLVSACLLGINCRYCGTGCKNELVCSLAEHHQLIPVCPEPVSYTHLVAMLIDQIETGLVYKLGIYLPLLVTNSLIVQKSETRFRKAPSKGKMVLDLLLQMVGFTIVACLVGAIRELLGRGTLWGYQIGMEIAPAVLLPFAGFMMIAFLSAIVNRIKQEYLSLIHI